jgi:ribosomal protein S18 acetylase RimI-like enzyme
MEIRRVRPDEWQALRDLRLRALRADPEAFGESLAVATERSDADWQTRADSADHASFVADAGHGLIGMVVGGPAPDRPGIAAVYGMWVAPEARGQGIGAALLDAVEDWAHSAGYTFIGLGVTTSNEPAIRLYEQKGYTDIGERYPLRDGTDLTIQIMGKPL